MKPQKFPRPIVLKIGQICYFWPTKRQNLATLTARRQRCVVQVFSAGIPTYTGMKTGFHADVSPIDRFSCPAFRTQNTDSKSSLKTHLRHERPEKEAAADCEPRLRLPRRGHRPLLLLQPHHRLSGSWDSFAGSADSAAELFGVNVSCCDELIWLMLYIVRGGQGSENFVRHLVLRYWAMGTCGREGDLSPHGKIIAAWFGHINMWLIAAAVIIFWSNLDLSMLVFLDLS